MKIETASSRARQQARMSLRDIGVDETQALVPVRSTERVVPTVSPSLTAGVNTEDTAVVKPVRKRGDHLAQSKPRLETALRAAPCPSQLFASQPTIRLRVRH